ncbi:beta-propeller domain-containing protein, partial [Candidatus Bathyarchaeota archaeon]|nr:beta-propeller domain-containing protein [Candidatus Bathyarchaeota archaeon]
NHIIGIGKDEGKVKISLFDVSNVSAPKEARKYMTGKWSDSLALGDHKAFLFDKSKNLLVMPITVYQDYVWQGAYVFNVSIEEGIVLRGRITHMENVTDKAGLYYYSPNYVKRALYIDNVLYTISDKKIKMNSLETLQEINEVKLS